MKINPLDHFGLTTCSILFLPRAKSHKWSCPWWQLPAIGSLRDCLLVSLKSLPHWSLTSELDWEMFGTAKVIFHRGWSSKSEWLYEGEVGLAWLPWGGLDYLRKRVVETWTSPSSKSLIWQKLHTFVKKKKNWKISQTFAQKFKKIETFKKVLLLKVNSIFHVSYLSSVLFPTCRVHQGDPLISCLGGFSQFRDWSKVNVC